MKNYINKSYTKLFLLGILCYFIISILLKVIKKNIW